MKRYLPVLALLALSPAFAGEPAPDHSAHAPAPVMNDPHAGHDMPAPRKTDPDPHAGHDMPAEKPPAADDHAAHQPQPAMQTTEPEPPSDFAADRVFGPDAMAASRAQLYREHGGAPVHKVMLSTAEYAAVRGGDGYRWEGEAWYGGDLNRIVAKSEGEGAFDGDVEHAEVQLLYSRAIGPYFDVQAGLRHDFEPRPSRSYVAIGFEGLAPYWFEVDGAAFVSDKGDVFVRLSVSYDQLLTQRFVAEPRAELNAAAQTMPGYGVGRGLTDIDLGLRLRYDVSRRFSPYIGVSYETKLGRSADFARAAGERVSATRFVAGLRAWF